MRLIISDRGYFIFLAVLPFIMGVLSLSVPGDVGFGVPVPAIQGGEAPNEPGQILVLLNVGAIFMGTALTIRALIGERAIFLREQAVGLSTTAYLLAKVVVFAAFAVLQSAIVVAINIYGKKWGPGAVTSGAVIPNRTLELFVDMAACCVAAAMVGLGALGAGQIERADHAAAGDRDHVAAGVPGRHDPGDGPNRARPVVMDHACAVGIRQHRVDDRPHETRTGPADSARLALEAHPRRVVVQHGHARVHLHRLPELRAVEDPSQGRLGPYSLAVDVEPVGGGERQRLLDVDPCAAQSGGGPQRRVDARPAQVGLVEPGVLRAGAPQVRPRSTALRRSALTRLASLSRQSDRSTSRRSHPPSTASVKSTSTSVTGRSRHSVNTEPSMLQ